MKTYKFDLAFDEALGEIADSESVAQEATSKPEVIRRAVALYRYLHLQVGNSKRKVAIIQDDEILTVIDPLP